MQLHKPLGPINSIPDEELTYTQIVWGANRSWAQILDEHFSIHPNTILIIAENIDNVDLKVKLFYLSWKKFPN